MNDTTTSLNGSATHQNGQTAAASKLPVTEVVPKAKRRTFSASYKRRILREADRCTQRGQIGDLLRREGLYSSHLTDWRRQEAAAGDLRGTNRTNRGPKPKQTAEQKENARLRRENAKLQQQLAQAKLIIAAQKKVAELLDLMNQQHTEPPS